MKILVVYTYLWNWILNHLKNRHGSTTYCGINELHYAGKHFVASVFLSDTWHIKCCHQQIHPEHKRCSSSVFQQRVMDVLQHQCSQSPNAAWSIKVKIAFSLRLIYVPSNKSKTYIGFHWHPYQLHNEQCSEKDIDKGPFTTMFLDLCQNNQQQQHDQRTVKGFRLTVCWLPVYCALEAIGRKRLAVPQGFWLSSISESLQLIVVYHRNQPLISISVKVSPDKPEQTHL